MRVKHCQMVIFILLISALFLVVTQQASQAKSINLSLNKPGPTVHKPSQAPAEFMAREVEKRTNGRVKITVFPGSTLASPPETFDATIKGICDIGESVASYTAGRFPASEACDLPLGYPNAWVAGKVATDFYDRFKPKEWNEIVPLYFASTPPAVLGTIKKPIRRIEDLKGLTIRTQASSAKILKAFGGVPRVLPITGVYEALAKGVVDGVLVPMEVYFPFKFIEVIKYVTDTSFVAYGAVIYNVMNKRTWNKISPADQKIIREVGLEASDLRGRVSDAENEKGKKGFIAKKGREYITLPPAEAEKFSAAADTVVGDWVRKKTAAGYPAADYVKYLRERIEYWRVRLP